MREKSDDPQLDLFTGDHFIYRCILTNDHESSEKEVIEYYNQRGGSDVNFLLADLRKIKKITVL